MTDMDYAAEVFQIAEEARAAIRKIGARSALLEAAMRVIMKHNLIDDLVEQMAVAKEDNEKLSAKAERDREAAAGFASYDGSVLAGTDKAP